MSVASWFAAEAGQRAVFATQHLHGGMGADISYPIHRYFLWGKQIELHARAAERPAGPAGPAVGRRAAGRPAGGGMSAATRAHAGAADPTTLRFEDVAVGDALPELALPLTRTLIVSTAIASRDYQDVHHDSVLAVERGSKDIFMNILSTNGLVGRYVTDWSGPGRRAHRRQHPAGCAQLPRRHHDPDRVGDGQGRGGRMPTARGGVEVTLRGANSLGRPRDRHGPAAAPRPVRRRTGSAR